MATAFRNRFPLALVLAAALAAPLLTACPATVPTDQAAAQAQLNYTESIAIRSVTAARQTNTAMLQAGKINAAAYDVNVARLDAIIAGIRAARASNSATGIGAGKSDADAITKQLGGTPP